MPDRPLAPPVLGRRAALCAPLAGLAATVLAAGCDTGDDIAPSTSSASSTSSGSPSTSPTTADATASATASATEDQRSPDEVLVDDVLAGLTAALGVLGQARKSRELRAEVAPLIKAHRRHVEVLEGELTREPPPGPAPAAAVALRLVRRRGTRPAGDARRRRRARRERRAGPAAGVDVRLDRPSTSSVLPTGADAVTELDALQTTLEAEHAAVYVYGLLGSRTSQAGEPELYAALRAAYEAHRERRDTLIGEIAGAGRRCRRPPRRRTPRPAGLDTTDGRYAGGPRARARLRGRPTPPWSGRTTGDAARREAIDLLNDAAARELSFRGTPEIFPGADEYADR